MSYIPAIEGLRGLAILIVISSHLVIASHLGTDVIPGGFGVTLFFFISGFLITGLLLREDRVAIGAFYARRFLRLAPALIVSVIVVVCTFSALGIYAGDGQIAAALLYYTNYFWLLGGAAVLPLGALWSLAVEEHYYLIYPWIIRYKSKYLLIGMIAVCAMALAWRCVLVVHFNVSEDRIYYATDTRIDSIIFGAILALLMYRKIELRVLSGFPAMTVGAVLLLLSLLIRDQTFRNTLRFSMQGLALIPLFYWSVYCWPKRFIANAPLMWVGRLSYSLYLWHVPAISFVQEFNLPAVTAVPLFTVLAAASYYFVERPFLGLRKRFHATETRQIGLLSFNAGSRSRLNS